ncbi:MAG: hypothetical protein HRU12_24685 [Phaeodactylibacter sp.]|nr:hypothetical protein [Phaeodactylibacter sp.]
MVAATEPTHARAQLLLAYVSLQQRQYEAAYELAGTARSETEDIRLQRKAEWLIVKASMGLRQVN